MRCTNSFDQSRSEFSKHRNHVLHEIGAMAVALDTDGRSHAIPQLRPKSEERSHKKTP